MLSRILKVLSLEPTLRRRSKLALCSSCSLALTRTSATISPQALAVDQEFRGNGGEEQLNAGHSSGFV